MIANLSLGLKTMHSNYQTREFNERVFRFSPDVRSSVCSCCWILLLLFRFPLGVAEFRDNGFRSSGRICREECKRERAKSNKSNKIGLARARRMLNERQTQQAHWASATGFLCLLLGSFAALKPIWQLSAPKSRRIPLSDLPPDTSNARLSNLIKHALPSDILYLYLNHSPQSNITKTIKYHQSSKIEIWTPKQTNVPTKS